MLAYLLLHSEIFNLGKYLVLDWLVASLSSDIIMPL